MDKSLGLFWSIASILAKLTGNNSLEEEKAG